MEDTDLQWGWPKTEMAMVKAPGPFYKFSDPKKDSSKLIRRNKGRKKSMNLDSFVARSLLPNTPTFDRDDDHEGNNQIEIHHPRQIRENVANISVSAQWMILLASFCLEIISAVFEQITSPSKPHFALVAMVLAILALLTCLAELSLKGREARVRLARRRGMPPLFHHPPPRNRLFGTFSDVFGLLGAFFQLAFSIVQYAYLSRHVDNPIKVCFWPFLFIFCVAGSILIRNRRNTEDNHDTGEHSA
ncbi:unnamed protein product [Prunus armeniaca]|nr:hypothetical protein GBA52_020898 [Prunus armeniaca]